MTKPIVITVPCGTNTVSRLDILEQDGDGAMQKIDASGVEKGIAVTDKDGENNVGMMIQGLIDMPAAAASYEVGDRVEGNSSGVAAYASGNILGIAAETATIASSYTTTDKLKVYVNVDSITG